MGTLIANLPPKQVLVRRSFVTDFTEGDGEFIEGYWVSVKSVPGRALYFETYLPEYGAVYDKLPLHAFVSPEASPASGIINSEILHTPALSDMQYWDAMDYGVTVIEKTFLKNMLVVVRPPVGNEMRGTYWFTIDFYRPMDSMSDLSWAHSPSEHKSVNIIALDGGLIVGYPNNRCQFFDGSLTGTTSVPRLKASTRVWSSDMERSRINRYGNSSSWDYLHES